MVKKLSELTAIASLSVAGAAAAAPYQFEFSGVYLTTKVSFANAQGQTASEKATSTGGNGTYYLQPVTANAGPLQERAFLSKSAFVAGLFLKNQFDSPELTTFNSDSMGVSMRFVTVTDLIVEFDYSKVEFDGDAEDGDPDITVGLGRYLDDRTTAVISLNIPEDDVKIITGDYRKVVNGTAQGVYLAYDASLFYIDLEDDSGYGMAFGITYHFSDFLSVVGSYGVSKIADTDETAFTFGGNYFLSETLFGSVIYSKIDLDDQVETAVTAFRIGARF